MRPGPRLPHVGRQICSADRPADLRPDGKLAGDVRRPSGSMHDPIGRLCVPHRQRGPLVNTAACTSGRTSTPACSSGRRPPRRPQDSSGTRAKVSPRPSRRARSIRSNCPRSAPSTPHGWGTAHRCFSFDAKRLRRDVPRGHPEVVASPRAPRWQREFDVLTVLWRALRTPSRTRREPLGAPRWVTAAASRTRRRRPDRRAEDGRRRVRRVDDAQAPQALAPYAAERPRPPGEHPAEALARFAAERPRPAGEHPAEALARYAAERSRPPGEQPAERAARYAAERPRPAGEQPAERLLRLDLCATP
jgi:hypothetical protein